MTTERPFVIQSAVDTFGEVPEQLVKTGVENFMVAYETYLRANERYKQAFADSQYLLEIDADSLSDPDLRTQLEAIQSIYRGNGGA